MSIWFPGSLPTDGGKDVDPMTWVEVAMSLHIGG